MGLNRRLVSISAAEALEDPLADGSGVAYFTFDNTLVDTTGTYDLDAYDQNLFYTGGGINFNGSNARISNFYSNGALGNLMKSNNNSFSLSCYLKRNATDYGSIVEFLETNISLRVMQEGNYLRFIVKQSNSSEVEIGGYPSYAISFSNLYKHYFFTANHSTGALKIYVDGNLENSTTGWDGTFRSETTYSNNFGFSSMFNNYANFDIKKLRMFNKELNSSEVSSVYTLDQ